MALDFLAFSVDAAASVVSDKATIPSFSVAGPLPAAVMDPGLLGRPAAVAAHLHREQTRNNHDGRVFSGRPRGPDGLTLKSPPLPPRLGGTPGLPRAHRRVHRPLGIDPLFVLVLVGRTRRVTFLSGAIGTGTALEMDARTADMEEEEAP
ncbi:hypothetical protein M406DRAFT_321825 [Cryphonectria parasitica EP155]|uniref:Uncharacterized protein n=1 Tax=Cryphonectria parasitica (strain ATCC 38755 / EP155) TaxID=660469 RepID=A0A9P4Y7U6_CRYP1|nr:uncharacterized protein M406DRAFT_321825 [Cryphonectria parasitica EP155]KAF3768029.1 hypothetical protein M406DRAFT_321825 [Cryphonectria parasitica EP155]